jgi:hypothetical protein
MALELLQTSTRQCPWCGESIELTLDLSCGEVSYVEDCQVCCAPILVHVTLPAGGEGEPAVELRREND